MAQSNISPSSLIPFNHAAAGHDGVLSDPSGAMVIKPCTSAEIAFYESASAHPQFAHYMPTFMGKLSLTPHSDLSAAAAALTSSAHSAPQIINAAVVAPTTIPDTVADPSTTVTDWTPSLGKTLNTSTAIVLSNLTYGFQHPNVLDLKLGARLWDDNAPLAKRQRLDAVAASSTSSTLGFRIAGMRVWQGRKATSAEKVEDVDVDAEGYKVYGKEYGRGFRDSEDVRRAFEEFLLVGSAGITQELAQKVVARLLNDVTGLEAVMKGQESRMYSASILFVYEGDGEVLRKGFELEEDMRHEERQTKDGEEDDEAEDGENGEDDGGGPHTAVAKLIDFAHAAWVPGQGPDENALQGVRSVLDILRNLSTSYICVPGRNSEDRSSVAPSTVFYAERARILSTEVFPDARPPKTSGVATLYSYNWAGPSRRNEYLGLHCIPCPVTTRIVSELKRAWDLDSPLAAPNSI